MYLTTLLPFLIVVVAILSMALGRLDVVAYCSINEESVLRSAYLIAEQIPYTDLPICVHLYDAINITASVIQF